MFVLMAGIVLLLFDYKTSTQAVETGIERNAYGEGTRTEHLKIKVDGKFLEEMEIEIFEQKYEETELEEMFQRCVSKIEKNMLGDNKSADYVVTDLNLMKSLKGEPVDIEWELDHYQVMNIYGEIEEKQVVTEGTAVKLTAVIIYREDIEKQHIYQREVVVYPEALSGEKALVREIQEEIEAQNLSSQEKESLQLPTEIAGNQIQYFREMNDRGLILIILAIVTGFLFFLQGIQNKEQEIQKRKQQMIRDYPEILNKLTLFLGAGMTVKRAWTKVISDYEAGKKKWGSRYAYEEMKITLREMESGIAEAESYERFGKRCGCQEYVRFGALISQNMRKGSKGLNHVLHLEAIQAFENRKGQAKKKGEEAGTKLLIPMFIMMAEVFVIVIVPAFLTMQI